MVFNDATSILNISSVARTSAESVNSASQTVPFTKADKEAQSISLINEQTQTNSNQNIIKSNIDDIPALLQFFRNVEPLVSRLLMGNLQSKAFLGYDVSWEEDVDEISHIGTFAVDGNDMAALDVKFNQSGSLVAVAYGYQNHDTWCSHKGRVCAWNIKARDLNYGRPFFNTETSNCVQSLDFHPRLPGILAIGTFNGDITIYSIFQDAPAINVSSSGGLMSHSEPIAQVVWKKSLINSTFELFSIANDGKILVWDDTLHDPLRGYDGKTNYRCILTSAGLIQKSSLRKDAILGGTAMIDSKHNSNDLFVGTETGYILKVGVNKMSQIGDDGSLVSNCVLFSYESHIGQINALDLSPSYRNALATAGEDGTIRLYSTLQANALYILEPCFEPLCALSWSLSRPCVLAAGSVNGHIYIYDLKKNQSLPIVSFLAVSKGAAIVSLSFNNHGKLVVSDSFGKVSLWQLSTFLTKIQEGEDQLLQFLFESGK